MLPLSNYLSSFSNSFSCFLFPDTFSCCSLRLPACKRKINLPKPQESPRDFPLFRKLPSCRWERHAGNDVMAAALIPADGFESSVSTWKKRQMQTTWLGKQRMSDGGTELPPKAVCRALLLCSPASPQTHCGCGPDVARVWMPPAPFPQPTCLQRTLPPAATPSSTKAFSSRKGKCEGFVWLWIYAAAGWVSLLALGRYMCVCVCVPKDLWVTAPSLSGWLGWTGWRCPLEGPWTGSPEQTKWEKNITV